MSKSISLRIGNHSVTLTESDTQIAIRPRAGMNRSLDNELKSLATRLQVQRRGNFSGSEIVDIQASEAAIKPERKILRNAVSVSDESPVYHTSDDGVPFIPAGTIYLTFKIGVTDAKKQAILKKYSLALIESEPDGAYTVRASHSDKNAVEISSELQIEENVDIAEPDLITPRALRSFSVPDDPLIPRQWHLENTGKHNDVTIGFKQGADARVISAWTHMNSLGNSDVVVGIIDDGFDLSHPDLAEKSVNPWDFVRNSEDVTPEANPNNPELGDWHGTACAGVVIGKGGGGPIIGAAPASKLLPVRTGPTLDPVEVVKWFNHMTENDAWVVSCSWGPEAADYPLPSRIEKAITRCATEGRNGKGCVIVFSAGNDNRSVSKDGYSTHPEVITVSASTSMDERADYSNFGNEVSICAPSGGIGGWGIVTSDVRGTYTDAAGVIRSKGYSDKDYYLHFDGTSSACPLVAGVCALVLSANQNLTAMEVRSLLKASARRIGRKSDYVNGHSPLYGYGCIDAEKAVKNATAANPLNDI